MALKITDIYLKDKFAKEPVKVVHGGPVSEVKPDSFSGNQWFFGQIEFMRDRNKGIMGCKVSSDRVRHLRLDKVAALSVI